MHLYTVGAFDDDGHPTESNENQEDLDFEIESSKGRAKYFLTAHLFSRLVKVLKIQLYHIWAHDSSKILFKTSRQVWKAGQTNVGTFF